ncbi:MAG: glycoside hydrolase family 127 protein, partial [Eubacterium sp.]
MDTNNFSEHIELNQICIKDNFWSDKAELVRNKVIPYQYDALNDNIPNAQKSRCIENFIKANKTVKKIKNNEPVKTFPVDKWEYTDANCEAEAFHGWVFQDSDVYKWIEAVGYSLTNHFDSKLEKKADEIIDIICGAQMETGYLDTLYIINDREKIFTNIRDFHELYCFGHLTEAAISYFNATGKRKLLDAAVKFADLICNTFGEDKIKGYPGHEIAEMALVRLYELTGEKSYLQTAEFFINERGKKPYYFDIERSIITDKDNYFYNQAHKEPRYQHEAVGHAVRGVYLYSAMADIARLCRDDELYTACMDIWNNIETKKLYITGGIGATVDGESFSFDYDLPNDLAYCETCASIGLIFFARRMLEISPDSRYGDVMERALYNCVISGMSQDGKSFFYVNPLEVLPEASHKDSRKRHIKPVRQKWFSCACCPPNLARLISSLGEYCYTQNENTVFVHQYAGGEVKTDKGAIGINSKYAENGKVEFNITPSKPFRLAVRIPSWCDNPKFSEDYTEKNGYAYFEINKNTVIKCDFEQKIRIIKCS